MNRELPTPEEILEELADKAAAQIDKLAPVAFDAAFDEMTRYHRYLLSVNAARTQEGDLINYAAVAGESWRSPHSEWVSQYRGLFERAANRIGDAPDFIEKLAHAPLRLLPRRGDPQLSDDILRAILNLGPILMYRLQGWVTKRTVTDTEPGDSASPRLRLAGSDAKTYENLFPRIVGAWESLLTPVPSLYRWRDEGQASDTERWDSLRASWPYLWQHLQNTAYMLAMAVWNEDEIGTALLRDSLVRWHQALGHHFSDRAYLLQRRLLFPGIVLLDLPAAQQQIKPLLPENMPAPTPDELFNATLLGAHDDVLMLTAALFLLWSIGQKQSSNIGARTALEILRRELEDLEQDHHGIAQDKTFSSLMMDLVRLEIAGDRRPKGNYSSDLDGFVERLDDMTERRVVPGRIFTPSTLHGRYDLTSSFVSILLAKAPESDAALIKRVKDLASNEAALPDGDRSLREVLQGLDRIRKLLETPSPTLERGCSLLNPAAEYSAASEQLRSIVCTMTEAIEKERTARLRDKTIDLKAIATLRDSLEQAMLAPHGGIFFFRGFSISKAPKETPAELFTSRYPDLSKSQFVDPPMESEMIGFAKHYSDQVKNQAGRRVWQLFSQLHRQSAAITFPIEHPTFWQQAKGLASDIGPEPMLLVSRQAEGRALRQFVYSLREPPTGLTIERKSRQDIGQSYIATVEGIDVYGVDSTPGSAWLFSPYILKTVEYAILDADEHIVTVEFVPGDDLKGPLVAEFKQRATWFDWLVYDIKCEDPPVEE